MSEWIDQFNNLVNAGRNQLSMVLFILGIFWCIQIFNFLLKYRLNVLGIYPRHVFGLVGIICSPFLHANFEHMFFNTIPLFILCNLMLMYGLQTFLAVSIGIMIISGSLTWLFGRRAIHLGASSVILGYWSFLLVEAYSHPSVISIIIAVLCLYYLGGLFLNLFSFERGVSWEGHLFGFIAGIVVVFNYQIWVSLLNKLLGG